MFAQAFATLFMETVFVRRLYAQVCTTRTSCPSPTPHRLSLLDARAGLTLIRLHGMQHDLDGIVLIVGLVPLGPVVAHGVRKDVAIAVEVGRGNGRAHIGVTFKSVFCVLVPEVERAVGAGCREGAVYRVEGDVVYGVDVGDVALRRVTVTLEREVGAVVFLKVSNLDFATTVGHAFEEPLWLFVTYLASFSSTY